MYTAKRPALRRLWMIDRQLRTGTYPTVERLAELVEADAKTVRRDLDFLRDTCLAPVDYDRKRRGWGYTCATYRLPAVIITEGELVAMFLAGQTLRMLQGTPYADELQRAITKLGEFLPDEVSVHWKRLEQSQSFHQTVTTLQDINTFRELADAVLHHRQLRIRYWTASRDDETERIVDPYHLTCIDGDWYLLAWCHSRQSIRMFAPARIRELTPTGEICTPPADFHIGDFFDGTFRVVSDSKLPLQAVRLKFAPTAARYIREKIWHDSQRLEVAADSSVVLEMSLRSLVEVRRWVLSWGSECEVLEPAELRDDIRHEAAAILSQSTSLLSQPAGPIPERLLSKSARRPAKRKRTG